MDIYESGENYLETIYLLTKSKGNVRAIDVSVALNFTRPSVSRALQKLKKAALITIEDNGNIILSQQGYKLAESTLTRHSVIKKFLISIGINEQIADEDACKIEHVISPETYSVMKSFPVK